MKWRSTKRGSVGRQRLRRPPRRAAVHKCASRGVRRPPCRTCHEAYVHGQDRGEAAATATFGDCVFARRSCADACKAFAPSSGLVTPARLRLTNVTALSEVREAAAIASRRAFTAEQETRLRKLGCSDETIATLAADCTFHQIEFREKRVLPTVPERRKGVCAALDSAAKLVASLEAISIADHLELRVFLRHAGVVDSEPIGSLQSLVRALETQVYLLRSRKSLGRRPSSRPNVALVHLIAATTSSCIKPSRASRSKFVALCRICFDHAGIDGVSAVEDATRAFLADWRIKNEAQTRLDGGD